VSYPKHGQFIDAAGQVKCLECKWILSKCKCGGKTMGIATTADLADVYYTQWLKAAGGNVVLSKEYFCHLGEYRLRLECKKCQAVTTAVPMASDPNIIPWEFTVFVAAHKHGEPVIACPKCWKGMAYVGNIGIEKVYRCGNECPSPNGATFWTAGDITAFELSKANPVPASVGYKVTYTSTKPPVKDITWDGKALKLETPRDAVRAALKLHREGRRFR
jgi:hypothetical protein